jgi:hypothetical protein
MSGLSGKVAYRNRRLARHRRATAKRLARDGASVVIKLTTLLVLAVMAAGGPLGGWLLEGHV